MSENIKKCILKTISYSDIFDYPLTKTETWKFLISPENLKKRDLDESLKSLSSIILKNNFYCFSDRVEIIKKRLKREKESKGKIKIAQKAASFLSIIPTICLIGLSGSLSMKNSDENDDIDFFIIVKKKSVWTTRLLCLFMLHLLGIRRGRNDKKVKNKICINMIIDDLSMEMPKNRQNLYTAHEVAQMRPIFNRRNTYQKFINSNRWVERYLPNSLDIKILRYKDIKNEDEKSLNIFLSVMEYLAKKIQLWSIKKHQTIETVSDNFLAFHPVDYKDKAIKEYNKRLKKYKI